MVWSVLRYLEPLQRELGLRLWQTDKRTDILIANAALNYVVQQKAIRDDMLWQNATQLQQYHVQLRIMINKSLLKSMDTRVTLKGKGKGKRGFV